MSVKDLILCHSWFYFSSDIKCKIMPNLLHVRLKSFKTFSVIAKKERQKRKQNKYLWCGGFRKHWRDSFQSKHFIMCKLEQKAYNVVTKALSGGATTTERHNIGLVLLFEHYLHHVWFLILFHATIAPCLHRYSTLVWL